MFKSWIGFGIVCPDFKADSNFSLYNDGLYYRYSTVNINFDICNSTKFDFCKSDKEIKKFLSDFNFQLWSYNEYINF